MSTTPRRNTKEVLKKKRNEKKKVNKIKYTPLVHGMTATPEHSGQQLSFHDRAHCALPTAI